MTANIEESNWIAVIGRSLAYLCLKNANLGSSSLVEQAAFLEKLGLPHEDQAAVIGSTTASLRELQRQAKKKKGGSKSGKTKKRS